MSIYPIKDAFEKWNAVNTFSLTGFDEGESYPYRRTDDHDDIHTHAYRNGGSRM